jgi:hypothetical protein
VSLTVIVLVVVVIVAVVLILFAREIVVQIGIELKKIVLLFVGLFLDIGKFLFRLVSILWTIWSLLFILRWKTQYAVKYIFASTILGILSLGAFYLSAELVVALANGLRSGLPRLYARGVAALSSKFPAAYAWLTKFEIPRVPEITLALDACLFLLAVLIFRHHWHEFLASLRRDPYRRPWRLCS